MYTVINPTDVESLPGIWNAEPELSLYARECRKALWASERNPELAYMLRQPRMESAFLARLHCDPDHLPIERVQTKDYVGYALKLETVKTWQVIEGSLIKAAEYLRPKDKKRAPRDPYTVETLKAILNQLDPDDPLDVSVGSCAATLF